MTKGFFVTATDTGAGKTVVAAALLKALVSLGLNTGAMKPVESGCSKRAGRLVPHDGAFLKKISRMKEPLSKVTPVCLEKSLAPLLAALLEKRKIEMPRIRKTFRMLSERYDALVIEGIGGMMVPLSKEFFVADLAAEFGLPLIIVSRPSLGTINHTLLTVDCALGRGIEVAGIVINHSTPPRKDLAEKTNPALLARVSPVPVIGVFPCLGDLKAGTIEKAALKSLDLEILKKNLAIGDRQ